MTGTDSELLDERFDLVSDRIRQMSDEDFSSPALSSYFSYCASFLDKLFAILERSLSGSIKDMTKEALAAENHMLYEDIANSAYDKSFTNPDHIFSLLDGEKIPDALQLARFLAFLLAQIRGLIPYAYEGKKEIITIHAELFCEVASLFRICAAEGTYPLPEAVSDILYWFISDYSDVVIPDNVSAKTDPANDFLLRIICGEDLDDERYLYLSGEYVSDNERKTARFISSLPEEVIEKMADTFTEGYRKGFETAGKDLGKKTSVNIRYSLGFERVIKRAVSNFKAMGLESVIYRAGSLVLTSSGVDRIGFFGAIPNRQYDYDHKDDIAMFLDAALVTRRTEVLRDAYEQNRELARGHAGPAVMEVFGEEPFTPVVKDTASAHNDKTRKLAIDYAARASLIVNSYIPPEERSFTIISFPSPEIGNDFETIFDKTIGLNTLDYEKYQKIQQRIIDALDKAETVRIKGRDKNETDLTVSLMRIADPNRQTHFENCVADVNIPVGEVFTSPRLEGTNGLLHVSKVYLKGLLFVDLKIRFKDGMVSDYSCGNFDDDKKGRQFIKDNILYKRDTLPMGEFAIGTNTTAYRMARDHDIEARLPILIAEKTGPHFAIGDTCYAHEEDVKVYNPDGKEIISRENEISAKRKEDEKSAYFQCHTDITIAFDELDYIKGVTEDGEISVISDGRFVLPGTEELNIPLLKGDNKG